MKRKKLRKLMPVLLAGTLVLGACGGNEQGGKDGKEEQGGSKQEEKQGEKDESIKLNEPGQYPLVEEPVEMTMFRLSMPNVEDFASNDFSKFIEEKTNVKWQFLTANQDTAEEQLNLTMSSKPLPDVFLFTTPSVAKYGVREKLLIPLEDLIEENMPNFMAYCKENPDLLGSITQPDGHIYGLPSINDCYHCKYRNKMWVNTKHLNDLGLKVPENTEEFKDVIAKYLDANPNGVGISGSMGGWGQQFEDWITNAFILDPGLTGTSVPAKIVLSKDKKIVSIAVTDEYREALKYMNELYNMGAIYDGTFTQNYDQYRSLMNEEGDPVLFAPFGTISDAYDVNARPESYADYDVMAPIAGPSGVRNATYFMYDGIAENKFVVTVDCAHPELALRWIDYFYTLEGYLSMQFGAEEGKDWVLNPEGKVGLNGGPALYEVLNDYSSDTQNHDWQDVGLNFATDEIRLGSATDPDVDVKGPGGLEKLLFDATKEKCEPYGQDENSDYQVTPYIKLTADEQVGLEQVIVDVNKYLNENRTQFIRGDMDPNDDAAWQKYLDGFEAVGLQKILDTFQTAYDRQFGK